MPRLTPIDPETAAGKAKTLLDGVRASLGMVPNMARAMAASPAVLEGYLGFAGALAGGALDVFTNWFNHVAATGIDFPAAPALAA